jgi:hypothetical protein
MKQFMDIYGGVIVNSPQSLNQIIVKTATSLMVH